MCGMGSASPPPQQHHKSNACATALESFWAVDVLILALLAFFIIVGGATSTPVFIVGIVLALAYAIHAVRRHDRRQAAERTPEARKMRERRGF
jgi:uncharacterized membrane protein YecN with MAPEG domain